MAVHKYQLVAFTAINCTVAPTANEYATLTASALIESLVFGYTFSALAPPFLTTIIRPAEAVGNITPVLAATVVTLLNDVVNTVAVPCEAPAAEIASVAPKFVSVVTVKLPVLIFPTDASNVIGRVLDALAV